jgi:hypothetical protein
MSPEVAITKIEAKSAGLARRLDIAPRGVSRAAEGHEAAADRGAPKDEASTARATNIRGSVSTPFDRSAACPSCGAPMTFRFAGAHAQVCKHCRSVVARTDRALVAIGRMADLAELPSPFVVGATGRWGGEPFVVEGRVQMDRAGAPGAPWQETFVAFPTSGRWVWVASAQGRVYSTSLVPSPPRGLPPFASLRPGGVIQLEGYGAFTVAEVGRRRVTSGEGELPSVPPPGVITAYADLGAPGGVFGTIDYGDGRALPELYLGRQLDPAEVAFDAGAPVAAPEARVTAVTCPSCGGELPLVGPGTERVVCRYCGMTSDLAKGALVALRPAPRPPVAPYVPLGAEGKLRGRAVVCIGFVVRGCVVEGEHHDWREYLLYAGPSAGYTWLLEEDGRWSLATAIAPGEVSIEGSRVTYLRRPYRWKQSVAAGVEHVIGEFYWKVEIGETVQATEYQGPGGIVSVEEAATEVAFSFVSPLPASEVADAFGLPRPSALEVVAASSSLRSALWIGAIVVLIVLLLWFDDGSDGGGGVFVSPGFGSPSFGGK